MEKLKKVLNTIGQFFVKTWNTVSKVLKDAFVKAWNYVKAHKWLQPTIIIGVVAVVVAGVIVIPSLLNDEDSSSSTSSNSEANSSSSVVTRYSVAEALADVDESYTVNYTYEGEKFSNKYDSGIYFSDYTSDGFYFFGDTVYYFYLEADGTPVYSNNGDLEFLYEDEQYAEDLRAELDIASSFSAASWEFVEENEDGLLVYMTSDEGAVATADTLTDLQATDDIYYVQAIISEDDEIIEGFTTLTQDGDILAEATLSRFGKSNPLGIYDSILNTERLDPALVNDWYVYYELETNIGGAGTVISIDKNGTLLAIRYDLNGEYLEHDTYEYAMPNGLGGYLFADENYNLISLDIQFGDYGDVYIETLPAGGTSEDVQFNYAFNYYTLLFLQAAATPVNQNGFVKNVNYVERIYPGDEEFDIFVTDLEGAVAAYRVYDGPTMDESSTYIVVTQFASKEAAAAFMGDRELYNAFSMFSMYTYQSFALTGYETLDDTVIFEKIAYILPKVFVEPDYDLYPVPTAGQSLVDYLISYMADTYGFEYYNATDKQAPADSEYAATISELMEGYADIDIQDVIILYGDIVVDGATREMYVAIGIFPETTDMSEYFYHGVANTAILSGWLMVVGSVFNASLTWLAYQA